MIVCGTALNALHHLDDETVDLTVTSPPYNVDLGNNKYNDSGYDAHDDNMPYTEYIAWLKDVFALVKTKTKVGGRCAVNIGSSKNGRVPTHIDVTHFMIHDLEWLPFTMIVWDKAHTSNRAAWGSWMSPSCPSFPTPFEYIMVFAKDALKLQHKGEPDITREEFIDWSLALWQFPGEGQRHEHPAVFPPKLPKRCIKMFTYPGDLVIDPFAGVGTTLIEARRLGRRAWGCEKSGTYANIAKEELSKIGELKWRG